MEKFKINRKSIGFRLFMIIIPIVAVTSILLTSFSYIKTKQEMVQLSKDLLNQVAKDTSQIVQKDIRANAKLSEDISKLLVLRNVKTKEEIMKILNEEVKGSAFKALAFADKEGNYTDTNGKTTNIADTSHFEMAIGGTRAASELYKSRIDGTLEVAYCAPIKFGDEIIGVVAATRDGLEYSNIANSLDIGYGGVAYILDRESKQILAAPDKDLVSNLTVLPDLVKNNKDYEDFGIAAEKMIEEINGVKSFKQNGHNYLMVHTGILSDYWVIGIVIDQDDLLSGVKDMRSSVVFIGIAIIIISMILVFLFSKNMSGDVNKIKGSIARIASGDFSSEISEKLKNRKDEFGDIAINIEKISINMSDTIKDLQLISEKVDVSSGELNTLFQTLNQNNESISHSIKDVAEGNSSQTGNLSSITMKLDKFNGVLEDMNQCIRSISNVANDIDKNAKNSNEDMTNVTSAIDGLTYKFEMFIDMINKMGSKFGGITTITALIQQISEKTNLLSLNAAIESARAGEAGKGFSVVAEEIRKLALESSSSTSKINEAVDEIIEEMKNLISESQGMREYINNQGTSINNAISSFEDISKSINNIQPMINEVTDKAGKVEKEKKDILSSIDELLAISEEVTASSEEIATASEEVTSLSNEAVQSSDSLVEVTCKMRDELNKFKTR